MFVAAAERAAGQEERYFSFDDGDAHFVVPRQRTLPASADADQLARQPTSPRRTRKWKFVFLHHTPYSCANGIASIGSNTTVRNTWGPLFEQYGVDVVFDGHDHIYERTQLRGRLPRRRQRRQRRSRHHLRHDRRRRRDARPGRERRRRRPVSPAVLLLAARGLLLARQRLPGGPSSGGGPNYCSFERYPYTSVRLVGNTTLTVSTVDRTDTSSTASRW